MTLCVPMRVYVCVCVGVEREISRKSQAGESCPGARHCEAGLRGDAHFAEYDADSERLGNLSKAT